ncbi:type VI secretion system TssO [Pedobacter sp. SYP-B3415]|uniref:type VI secretion system TssO n=1 Tax=Pedobacter sp. SYP-B3415 TaxID=2496641 RepID=UPI00101B772D|nr:type VI secretion system TssO [Pedobacter sp. SYP-B3415]
MKPINAYELKKSYQVFVLNFVFLLLFAVLCVYFYFKTSAHEYDLLSAKVKETEKLISLRKEINKNFDIALLRFRELSTFTVTNSEEMNRQAVMLTDIRDANVKIKSLVKENREPTPSFMLYDKLSDNVATMAGIQDSLSITGYQIETLKDQLKSCLKNNRAAEIKINRGR